jgi:hypothetical protein
LMVMEQTLWTEFLYQNITQTYKGRNFLT